jgi:hypothetical protein
MSGFGRIMAAVLAGVFVAQPVAHAGTVRHQWSAAGSTKYYEGRITQGTRTYRFRTPGTSVLLDGEAKIAELYAVDRRGRKTAVLPAIATPLPTVPAEAELATAGAEPAGGQPPPAPETAAAPEPPDENDPWPKGEPSVKNLNRIVLALGAGRERVEAVAGVSKFDATSTIGGTLLGIQHQPDGSHWVFQGMFEAHNFTTEAKEADASTGSTTVKEERVLRILGQGELLYDFFYADKAHVLAFGGGATLSQVPTLDVFDAETKAAELKDEVTVGPHLAVQYGWLGEATHAGAQAFFEPFTFNSRTKGSAYGLSLFGRHFVTGAWAAEGLLGYRAESNTVEKSCEGVPSCAKKSKASGNVLQLMLGIGYEFR